MLQIYNTLTKRKEEFKPINPPEVKMYTCGPTVYDYFHIGNARSFIMADIIRKYLIYSGYDVTFIMNLTDVDDKIIKKANQEKVDSTVVAQKYSEAFLEDIMKLKIAPADAYPKATGHMHEIIDMIQKLVTEGTAYNIKGNVFYDVSKFKEYGKLSGKKIEELESGARVEINEDKHNPLDFSLWKKAKPDEPYWESPWGNGRPGWHIECSAMSCKHLGETFDIHAGGSDLIFPHHENEIAQSEAANHKKFVNYWLHFGFLNINDEKMSKSLGNFFTTRDILKKYSAEAIRLFFSQCHYAGPLNFSEDLLIASSKGVEKISNLKEMVEEKLLENKKGKHIDFNFEDYEKAFKEAMDDDFNSPKACAVIFDFIRDANKTAAENPDADVDFFYKVDQFLTKTADGVLGVVPASSVQLSSNGMLENELIEFLLQLRTDAKKDKNFAMADKIRNGLNELGIELKDGKDKTTFKKTKA
jgi:cysteinyl-tRNA synthetase